MSSNDNELKNEVNQHKASLGNIIPIFLNPNGPICCFPNDKYEEIKNNSKDYEIIKRIHFVRHGQGFHNLRASTMGYGCSCDDPEKECPYIIDEILDARLTDKGKEEAKKLYSFIDNYNDIIIDHILVSPLSRAIETSLIGLNHEKFKETKRDCLDVLREQYGIHTCDSRQSKSWLEKTYPSINFSNITENDYINKEERETKQHLAERINQFYNIIKHMKSSNIVIFTHSSFLFTMSGEWFKTGELRSFVIAWKK